MASSRAAVIGAGTAASRGLTWLDCCRSSSRALGSKVRKTPPTSGGIAADVESDDTRRKATANATGNAEEVPTRLFANRDAERALLGYLIDHPDAVTSMPIEVDLFSVPDHRRTYDAIVDLATSRGTVDSIVLGNELRRRGVPEPGYLVAVLRESGGLDVTGLVRVLKECATRRRIHTCARALQAGAFDPTKHVDDLLAEMGAVRSATPRTSWH